MGREKILVTGSAGFIGFFLCQEYLARGYDVVGVDSFNDYYSVRLKEARNDVLTKFPNFKFVKLELADKPSVDKLFNQEGFSLVVHMAAQAGVRYSLKNPSAYIQSNEIGFFNVLENCRQHQPKHFVYASSSSVYGLNTRMPFSEKDHADHPISLYAATKKSNELKAHAYSYLFKLPVTGLRFFTVYGPWGRPDMAYFSFAEKIMRGQPIDVFFNGNAKRDFTYIDDIVAGVVAASFKPPTGGFERSEIQDDPSRSISPFRIYNIGNNRPVLLTEFIKVLESKLGREAKLNLMEGPPEDVAETFADIDALKQDAGFSPKTNIDEGLGRFAEWYLDFWHKPT